MRVRTVLVTHWLVAVLLGSLQLTCEIDNDDDFIRPDSTTDVGGDASSDPSDDAPVDGPADGTVEVAEDTPAETGDADPEVALDGDSEDSDLISDIGDEESVDDTGDAAAGFQQLFLMRNDNLLF